MWRRVDLVWSDVSEERISSIFRIEKSASEGPARNGGSSYLLTLVPCARIFLSWWWRRCVPPKRHFTQDLHGATFQKTIFILNVFGFNTVYCCYCLSTGALYIVRILTTCVSLRVELIKALCWREWGNSFSFVVSDIYFERYFYDSKGNNFLNIYQKFPPRLKSIIPTDV
jgi:hypothetical protein